MLTVSGCISSNKVIPALAISAMRRSAYGAVGPFGGIELAEDSDWGHRATSMGYAIGYVPTMIVYHPARQSFADLCTKWDRHISHDFTERVWGDLVTCDGFVAASLLSPRRCSKHPVSSDSTVHPQFANVFSPPPH